MVDVLSERVPIVFRCLGSSSQRCPVRCLIMSEPRRTVMHNYPTCASFGARKMRKYGCGHVKVADHGKHARSLEVMWVVPLQFFWFLLNTAIW